MRIEIAYRWFLILVVISGASYLTLTSPETGYSAIPYFGSYFAVPAAVALISYDWYRKFHKA